jgi:hypothetical protein
MFYPQINGASMAGSTCPTMQVPGPTLIVNEGATVQVTLTNNLPLAAGNTSILFPGFNVTTSCSAATPVGVKGLLACEATPGGGSVTYTFQATSPGTRAYYSGTQGDLQIEMGLYGAIIVLPATPGGSAGCSGIFSTNNSARKFWNEGDFRNSSAAYDISQSCYDREYLFQWAEMDARIHHQAEQQVLASANACSTGATTPGCSLNVQTEPYHPSYFLINGRSMPDLMDPNYAGEYPHQPYNGNPHMHPGERTLIRTIGQGRWQHPFHEHANHVRILARDGNLILTPDGNALAGLLMFNTDTTPGQAFDGIFYFTGRGLNWDPYGHHPNDTKDPLGSTDCVPDADGYYTQGTTAKPAYTQVNYFEWCQDHNKPVEVYPFGDVASGGPATLPNPNILTNGAWYGGTPYLGPDATLRGGNPACATGNTSTPGAVPPYCTPLNPANVQANPSNERGWAFMWHSHNEREITTNNVFPGGMLMMMLVDSREFQIDETN